MGNYLEYLLIILYYCLVKHTTKGNILDVTLFNQRPLLLHTVSDNENTFFGGYKSSGDIDATISLGRAADTGTGPDWPPYPTGYRIESFALGGKAYRIMLPATGGVERIGAFYVDAEKGTVLNRIITVTMAHSAGVMPESFTKMASIGDYVTLTMQPVTQTTMLEWRFNGVVKPTWVGRTSVLIPGVTKADEGIYECYVTGDREQGRQAIMRLIVRDCPPSQWNPPLCDQECPICYNGGVCDAQSGLCVCPPGFGGTNCEAVYGRNRWGNDGQLACRGTADRHSTNCKGRLFCRPDPYGCSCIAGYKGLDCLTDCDSGTFGAGCTQQCHCEGNSCLLDSGECPQGVGCMAGWTGVNCQVPDPCPAGYYGSLCTKRCRCKNNVPCNQQNGYCNNGCQTGYIGPECVDDGSPKLVGFMSQEQVNSGHTTVLVCNVTGNPIPTRYVVSVTDSSGAELPLNETEKHSRYYNREVRFAVRVTESGANYSCSLTLPDGSSMVRMYTVNVYTPPILTNAPTIPNQNITANSVLVKWTRWDSSMGGDGPVDRYIVQYRESSLDPNAPYTNFVEVSDGRRSSTMVGGLNWDTDYDFVVIAARQGERGEGPPSPKTSATTKCDVPTASADISDVTAFNSTALVVTWQLPPAPTWRCRSLRTVYIRWQESGEIYNPTDFQYIDAHIGTTVITSLKPCVVYEIKTLLFNGQNRRGPFSPVSSGKTATAVPGPVFNLTAAGVTSNPTQINVTWQLPKANACPVDSYQVTYHKTETIACAGSIIMARNTTVPSTDEVFILRHLLPYSRYRIVVSALNTEGEGEMTSTQTDTISAVPSAAPLTRPVPPGEKHRLRFSWTPVDCKKINGPFVNYKYQLLDRNGGTVTSETSSEMFYNLNATFRGLSPCTEYFFRIRVATDKGPGPYSENLSGTTEIGVPGPVQMLRVPLASISPTAMTINWQEPTNPPCVTERYSIQLKLIERDQCSNDTSPRLEPQTTRLTTHRVMGLVPFSTYSVSVTAMTTAGKGDSMVTTATTREDVPKGKPINIERTDNKKRSLSFQWKAPPCGSRGGNITWYSYQLTDPLRNRKISDTIYSGMTQVKIRDLIPFVEYEFKVRAFTSVGPGPFSDPVVERTAEAKPAAPANVTTPSADSQSITVRWDPPDPPQGNITAYYIIYWKASVGSQPNTSIKWTDLTSQPPFIYDITPLDPQTEYAIVIQAETLLGLGPISHPPVTRITKEGYPSAPSNLRLTSREQTQLIFAWDIPKNPNGNILHYSIMYRVTERSYDMSPTQQTPFMELPPIPSSDPHSVTISGLEPSTRYEVQVAASTKVGQGDYATGTAYTALAMDIDAPVMPPGIDPSAKFSDTAVAIRLTSVTSKYVSAYYIQVQKKTGIGKRDVQSYHASPNSYITAELDKNNAHDSFVVGDNKTYGRFYNPPLQKGTTYDIRQGSVSKAGEEDHVVWGPSLIYTAGTGGIEDDGTDTTSIIVGVIMGILAVAMVAVIVAVLIVRQSSYVKMWGVNSTCWNVDTWFKNVGYAGAVNMVTKRGRQKEARMKKSDETNMIQLNNVIVNKNGKEASPRPKLKNINSEPNSQIRRAQSDDALSNLDSKKNDKGQGSPRKPSGHKPLRVDQLADYVKAKRSETTDGLKKEYMTLPEGKLHPWTVAMKPENKQKNRYGNIITYDHSRVKLKPLEGDPHSDYINACYIDGYKKANAYIACQGPNTASVNDIWRMAWQEKSSKIIMVTNLNEGGKKKCEKYWPDKSKSYRDVEVTFVKKESFPDYCTRTFSLCKDDETRELVQFHFISWPDMGVPSYAAPLLKFIKDAKDFNPPKSGPTIVHCSAGVGRTGTLLTLDTMLDQAKQENQVDVYNYVRRMRDRRIKMVQTPEQYVFIFDALLEALICGDTSCLTEAFCTEFHRLKTRRSLAGKSLMQEQFEALDLITLKPSAQLCRGGSDPSNENKNRYINRLPFDKFRPYLMTEAGENCTNYINASFLDGYIRKNMFFATQMPLPNTVIDFWRLIFDYNSNTIVMLNAMDHNDASMCQYWPESGSTSYGPFNIELISSETSTDIITRTFYLTNTQRKLEEPRKIRQFQYTGWPNGSETPKTPDTILALYSQVERWCPQTSEDSPVTVHCLDGMGVTGTFCTIFMVLDRLKTEQSIDVFQAAKKLRMTRSHMVQSLAQYTFCYETVLAYLDSMELYGNFKL